MGIEPSSYIAGTRDFHLLVVDASELDFELLVATLSLEQMPVVAQHADSMAAFQTQLAARPWDAVIADFQPELFPLSELLARLRALDTPPPLLLVSDPLGEETAVAAMRAGVDDCLIKSKLARLSPALLNAVAAAHQRAVQARADRALEASERRLRELLAHLESVVDEERTEIAREIHDDVGGMLTALRLDIGWIARHGDGQSAERAGHAMDTLAQVMTSAQRIQRNLRPPILDAGLLAAMHWQIGEFRRRSSIDVKFESNVPELTLDAERAMAVYRTLQESLTNVAKHANAQSVAVSLVAGGDDLSLEITDDGRGITDADLAKATSFGLRGMGERAQRLGGWVDVSPGARGTCVLLCLPMPRP